MGIYWDTAQALNILFGGVVGELISQAVARIRRTPDAFIQLARNAVNETGLDVEPRQFAEVVRESLSDVAIAETDPEALERLAQQLSGLIPRRAGIHEQTEDATKLVQAFLRHAALKLPVSDRVELAVLVETSLTRIQTEYSSASTTRILAQTSSVLGFLQELFQELRDVEEDLSLQRSYIDEQFSRTLMLLAELRQGSDTRYSDRGGRPAPGDWDIASGAQPLLALSLREPNGEQLAKTIATMFESVSGGLTAWQVLRWVVPPAIVRMLNAPEVYILHRLAATASKVEPHESYRPTPDTLLFNQHIDVAASAIETGESSSPRYIGRGIPVHLDLLLAYARIAAELAALIDWIETTPTLVLDGIGPRGQKLACDVRSYDYSAHLELLRRVDAAEQTLSALALALPPSYHTLDDRAMGPPLRVSSMNLNLQPVGYRAWALRFDVAPAQIIDMVSSRAFYRRRDAAIRELLQNAIDACRLRSALARQRSSEYLPRVSIELRASDNTLRVSDNGQGMTEAIIRDYFGKVGRSFYRENLHSLREIGFEPLGSFGIGLLAAFVLADSLVVETRGEDGKCYEVTISDVQSYFAVRDATLPEQGTNVILHLRRPLDFDLEDACRYYARLVEFPITVCSQGRMVEIPAMAQKARDWRTHYDWVANERGKEDAHKLRTWQRAREHFRAIKGSAASEQAHAEVYVVIPDPHESPGDWYSLPEPKQYLAICNRGILVEVSRLGLQYSRPGSNDTLVWYGVYGWLNLSQNAGQLGPTREYIADDSTTKKLGSLVTEAIFHAIRHTAGKYRPPELPDSEKHELLRYRHLIFELLIGRTSSGAAGRKQDMLPGDVPPYGDYDKRYSVEQEITSLASDIYGSYYPISWLRADGTVDFRTLHSVLHSGSDTIMVVCADEAFWRPWLWTKLSKSTIPLAVVDSTREIDLIDDYCARKSVSTSIVFLEPYRCVQLAGLRVTRSALHDKWGARRFVTVDSWRNPTMALDVLDRQTEHGYRMHRRFHTAEPGPPLYIVNLSHPFGQWLAGQEPQVTKQFISAITQGRDFLERHSAGRFKYHLAELIDGRGRVRLPSWPTEIFARSVPHPEPLVRVEELWHIVSDEGLLKPVDDFADRVFEDRKQKAWWTDPVVPRNRGRSALLR